MIGLTRDRVKTRLAGPPKPHDPHRRGLRLVPFVLSQEQRGGRTGILANKTARPVPRVSWDVLAAVATGGALGSVLRYGVSVAMQGPLGTLLVNLLGCLGIGALMFVLTELMSPHRLVRPFLGVGVLGGFTTFSTYIIDAVDLVAEQRFLPALGYLFCTVVGALIAVVTGATLAQLVARLFGRERP